MATELNPTALRGLIVQDPRFSLANVSAADSSFQEAGAEPAQPVETVAGELSLNATGTLTTDAPVDIKLTSRKSGAAVGGDRGGRFVWRHDSDPVTDLRGSLSPNKVTGWEHAVFDGAKDYERPDAITLADDTVVVCYSNTTDGQIESATLNPANDTWSTAVIDSTVPGPGCLVPLPSGRVICIYARDDQTTGGASFTLGLAHSDDNGATWTVDDKHLTGWSVQQSDEDEVRQLRAAYHDGFITMIVETRVVLAQVRCYHLVSNDRGASWDEIETLDTGTPTANDPKSFNIIPRPDGSLIMPFIFGASGNKVGWVRKTSPRSVLTEEPSYETPVAGMVPDNLNGAMTAAVIDGGLWLYVNENSGDTVRYKLMSRRLDPDTMVQARSRWSASRDTTGGVVPNDCADFGSDTAEAITQMTATPYKGGVLLIHNPLTNSANTDNIGVIYMGGYSSVDWPVQVFGTHKGTGGDLTYGMLFVGSHDPSVIAAWTTAGAGATSNVADGFEITSTANAYSVTRNGPAGAGAGAPCLAWGRLKVVSGGATGLDQMAIRLRRADGTNDYDISLRFTDTTARVIDNNNAGALVGSALTGLTAGVTRDWLIGLAAGSVAVYYKTPHATLWTLLATASNIVNDTTTPDSENEIQWGALATGTASSIWGMVGSCIDQAQEAHKVQNFTADDLGGRAFDTLPQWLGETEGLFIQASGGSTAKGDSWDVVSRAQYGLHNAMPEIEPSPSVGWRTTLASASQEVVWVPNTNSGGAALATRLLSSSIGMYVSGCNVKTLFFEGRQVGTSTWDTLINITQTGTFGAATLTADLDGDWLRPAAATSAGGRFIDGGELIGGYAILTWTGGGGGTEAFEILDNTEGMWRDPASSRAVEILLSGDTSSVSGDITVELIPTASVGFAHGVTTEYDGYRLRMAGGQDVATGDYRLGVVVIGPMLVFSQQYSRGRVIRDEAQFEEYVYPDGAMRRRALNRTQRIVSFNWLEGFDSTQLFLTNTPDPDYLTASSTAGYDGIALLADHGFASGMLRRFRGVQPVVCCPVIEPADGAAPASQAHSGLGYVYGWPSGVSNATARLGDELDSEYLTLDGITITEIL